MPTPDGRDPYRSDPRGADRFGALREAAPILLATAIGVGMGFAALGFIYPIEWMEHLLGEEITRQDAGLVVTVRRSRGLEVAAACGQLRGAREG